MHARLSRCTYRLVLLEELPQCEYLVRYLYHDRDAKSIRIFHQHTQTNLLQYLKRTKRTLAEEGMKRPVLEADEIVRYVPVPARLACRAHSRSDNKQPSPSSRFAQNIADGLQSLHTVGIVHRDLKCEHIFTTPTDNGNVTAWMLSIFTLAKKELQWPLRLNCPGSTRYRAPEVVGGRHYTPAGDGTISLTRSLSLSR